MKNELTMPPSFLTLIRSGRHSFAHRCNLLHSIYYIVRNWNYLFYQWLNLIYIILGYEHWIHCFVHQKRWITHIKQYVKQQILNSHGTETLCNLISLTTRRQLISVYSFRTQWHHCIVPCQPPFPPRSRPPSFSQSASCRPGPSMFYWPFILMLCR